MYHPHQHPQQQPQQLQNLVGISNNSITNFSSLLSINNNTTSQAPQTINNHHQQQFMQQQNNSSITTQQQQQKPQLMFTHSVAPTSPKNTSPTPTIEPTMDNSSSVGNTSPTPSSSSSSTTSQKQRKVRPKKSKKVTVTNNKEVIIRKHRKQITLEDIAQCFEMPIRDASQILGISLTQLKRLCREYNVSRWPYRRVSNLFNY
jgi:YesN/AraC family two-component response regulator